MNQSAEKDVAEKPASPATTAANESHSAFINDLMAKAPAGASADKAGDSNSGLTPTQSKLAELGQEKGERAETKGMSGRAVREVLDQMDIHIPRSDAKDIKDVPKMTQLPEGSKTQPGDLVIIGPQEGISKHGDSFFVTKDGQAASDRVKPMPELAKLHDVHIYRSDK